MGYFVGKDGDPEIQKKNDEEFVTIAGIRYFRTGDIGQVSPNGSLQIIDRKKDLWKGPQGEYVAYSKVEQALTMCEFVSLSMCYGRTGGEFPVALICPQKRRIEQLAQELQVEGTWATLCGNEQIVARVS